MWWRAAIDAIVAFDRSAEIGRIKTPTLVLCAKDDAITPAYFSEELAKKIPARSSRSCPTAGTAPRSRLAEDFNKAVLEFLQRA